MGIFNDFGNVFADVFGSLPAIGADALTQGAYSNAKAVTDTNKASMDFNERMSNTAYQRAMADMKEAGLNPMLAYQQGGASSPGANLTAPEPGKIGAGLANSAKDAIQLSTQVKNTNSQTDLNKENVKTQSTVQELNRTQQEKNKTQAIESRENATNTYADTLLKNNQIERTKHETAEAAARAKAAQLDLDVQKRSNPTEQKIAPYGPVLDRLIQILGGANSAKKLLQRSPQSSPQKNDAPTRDPRKPSTRMNWETGRSEPNY